MQHIYVSVASVMHVVVGLYGGGGLDAQDSMIGVLSTGQLLSYMEGEEV